MAAKLYQEKFCGKCEVELHVGFKLKDRYGTFRQKKDEYGIYPPVVQTLFRIDGIVSVALGDDFFFIKKAEVFSWDDILTEVYRVVQKYQFDKLQESMEFPDSSRKYHNQTKKVFYQNPDVMTIHVGARLSDELTFRSEYNAKLPLVADLRSIEGITEVHLDQYSVEITRNWNTKWRTIMNRIDEVIACHVDSLIVDIA